MNKFAFFFKDNFVYPFVNFKEKKYIYVITNNDFCDVISYVEHNMEYLHYKFKLFYILVPYSYFSKLGILLQFNAFILFLMLF